MESDEDVEVLKEEHEKEEEVIRDKLEEEELWQRIIVLTKKEINLINNDEPIKQNTTFY